MPLNNPRGCCRSKGVSTFAISAVIGPTAGAGCAGAGCSAPAHCTASPIVEDYALSETCVDYPTEFTRDHGQNTGHAVETSSVSRLMKLSRAALQPLLRSDPRYLEAMLTGLETSHGGVLLYLEAELGVGEVERQRLQAALLETA